LSLHGDQRFVAGMLEAGASSYFLKDDHFKELLEGVFAVAGGT
jgi:DNA-binding NarL/FixJ family response regulator